MHRSTASPICKFAAARSANTHPRTDLITHPNGQVLSLHCACTGTTLLDHLEPALRPDALTMIVNGTLAELSVPIDGDADIAFVWRSSPEALPLLRQDAAHVMAGRQGTRPQTRVTIGSAIEKGFYYDLNG